MTQERVYPDDLIDEVMEMAQQGFSALETAEETGWGIGTIRKIRREAGFEGRHIDPLRGLDTDALITDYRSGDMSIREVCVKYEISTTKFYKVLALLGEPTKKYDKAIDEGKKLQLDVACDMYEQGHYIYEIEHECGLSQGTIHKEIKKRGIPMRRPRSTRAKKIKEAYEASRAKEKEDEVSV